MKTVIVESPYMPRDVKNAEDFEKKLALHKNYARLAIRDCLNRGEAPFASHLLYTQVLCDQVKEERALGMKAGRSWFLEAYSVIFYTDLGMSEGMKESEKLAKSLKMKIEYRTIKNYQNKTFDDLGNFVEYKL